MDKLMRCKMRVQAVTRNINGDGKTEDEIVKLCAVAGNSDANKDWAQWTPSANFEIQINNPEAFGKLSKGYEFYVDFTPAE